MRRALMQQAGIFVHVLTMGISVSAQTGSVTASGPCAIANTAAGAKLTINCGIGQRQGEQIVNILNKILQSQAGPEVVIKHLDQRLDEFLKVISPNRQV